MLGSMVALFICLCALFVGLSVCWVLEYNEKQRRMQARRLARQRARQVAEAAQATACSYANRVVISGFMQRAG